MPRITHAQQQELEQKQDQAVADRAKIAEQHVVDIQKIEAQVKVVAAEHDAVVDGQKARIGELEAERDALQASVDEEIKLRNDLLEEITEEKTANKGLRWEIEEIRRRGEASLNILTASFLAVFGVAIAAIGQSKCQEPEL